MHDQFRPLLQKMLAAVIFFALDVLETEGHYFEGTKFYCEVGASYVHLHRFIEKDGGTRPCDILATRVANQCNERAGCQLLPTMWGR
jgi:hypothetical protein